MSSLFSGGSTVNSSTTQSAAAAPAPLPVPRTRRMPTETDPSVLEAAKRTRKAALQRSGRLSTILTDQTAGVTGSSGQALGA